MNLRKLLKLLSAPLFWVGLGDCVANAWQIDSRLQMLTPRYRRAIRGVWNTTMRRHSIQRDVETKQRSRPTPKLIPVSRGLGRNPPAPACQGLQGCVFRYSSLFNNYRSCFQLSGYLLLPVIRVQIGGRFPPADQGLEIRFHTKNRLMFMLVFKA